MQNHGAIFFLGISLLASSALAETICLNGGRGFILDGCLNGRGAFGGIPRGFNRVQRLPGRGNVFSVNGQLFERDRNNRFRQLFVDRNSGRILGATRQGTVGDVLGFYQQNLNNFGGDSRGLIEGILRANGVNPAFGDFGPNNVANIPPGGVGGTPGAGNFGAGGAARPGPHGNGNLAGAEPTINNQRPSSVSDSSRGPVPGGACRDLNQAMCSDLPNRAAQERQIDQMRRSVVGRFLQSTRTPFNAFNQAMVFFQQESERVAQAKGPIQLRDPSRFIPGYTRYLAFLSTQVGGARAAVENVRSSVLAAIESQPLDPSTKQAMRNEISQVKMRFTPDINNADSVLAFVGNCGPDGMSPGAFAVKETGEVVICPGMVLQAAAKGQSLEVALGHVVAHELGHHIDARIEGRGDSPYRPQYSRFEACLKETFPQYQPSQVDECTADHFGIEALTAHLTQQNASPEVAFAAIKAAVEPLCGSPADEEHPAGTFRIRNGVGRNPAVLKLLGCGSPDPERPGCTLEGKVPKGGI